MLPELKFIAPRYRLAIALDILTETVEEVGDQSAREEVQSAITQLQAGLQHEQEYCEHMETGVLPG